MKLVLLVIAAAAAFVTPPQTSNVHETPLLLETANADQSPKKIPEKNETRSETLDPETLKVMKEEAHFMANLKDPKDREDAVFNKLQALHVANAKASKLTEQKIELEKDVSVVVIRSLLEEVEAEFRERLESTMNARKEMEDYAVFQKNVSTGMGVYMKKLVIPYRCGERATFWAKVMVVLEEDEFVKQIQEEIGDKGILYYIQQILYLAYHANVQIHNEIYKNRINMEIRYHKNVKEDTIWVGKVVGDMHTMMCPPEKIMQSASEIEEV